MGIAGKLNNECTVETAAAIVDFMRISRVIKPLLAIEQEFIRVLPVIDACFYQCLYRLIHRVS